MREDSFDTNNALIQIRASKEDKRTVYGECTYRMVPQGGRAERVPDAQLDLSAECVNCPE